MGWHVGILLISLGVLLYVSYDLGCLPVKSMSVIHSLEVWVPVQIMPVQSLTLQLVRSEECCDSKRASLTNLLQGIEHLRHNVGLSVSK